MDGRADGRCLRPKRGNAPSSQHSGSPAAAAAATTQIEVKYRGLDQSAAPDINEGGEYSQRSCRVKGEHSLLSLKSGVYDVDLSSPQSPDSFEIPQITNSTCRVALRPSVRPSVCPTSD